MHCTFMQLTAFRSRVDVERGLLQPRYHRHIALDKGRYIAFHQYIAADERRWILYLWIVLLVNHCAQPQHTARRDNRRAFRPPHYARIEDVRFILFRIDMRPDRRFVTQAAHGRRTK